MKCPECFSPNDVTDSRERSDNTQRRRRACRSCGHAWTTVEVPIHFWKLYKKLRKEMTS